MADEIIEELWRLKEEMAREHGYDIEAFCAYLQRKDRAAGFRKVYPQKLKEMAEAGEVRQKRKNEFTAIMERDGEWFVAFCPEVPGANGQGKTCEEARKNLAEAVVLRERGDLWSRGAGFSQDFWASPSLEELAEAQGVKSMGNVRDLFGTWPKKVDDGFEEWIDEIRHPDRKRRERL